MYKILKNTSFGFIFELENDYCYYVDSPYDIYLNRVHYLTTNKNVVSLLSLKSDTTYDVLIRGYKEEDICFTIKTCKPNWVINVRDYNALGDGQTDDTSAISMAIYTAPVGSTVYIPNGEYLVDQILLKSGVDIYLEQGAVIRQNIERNKLAILKGYQKNYDHSLSEINASWEGHPLDCYASLIYGKDIKDVHIYGDVVLDGNGDIGGFWVNPKKKNRAFRPKNIFLVNSSNIEVSGITSKNSASWNIHPFYCKGISFCAINIESVEDSPNTDGLNPESCYDVEIVGCHFSVGDDCIAIKAGKYYMSTAHMQASEGIRIRNCLMEKGHGGVVIGSEMSCGVLDVVVTQCLFRQTDRGLRVKTRRGRGKYAIVRNIIFNQVQMESVRHCFVINMFYHCDPDGKSDYVKNKDVTKRDDYTPSVENIIVTNVTATDIQGSAVFIYGLPESKVTNIQIKDNKFAFALERVQECPAMMDDFEPIENLGFYINNADEVVMNNNDITGECVEVLR